MKQLFRQTFLLLCALSSSAVFAQVSESSLDEDAKTSTIKKSPVSLSFNFRNAPWPEVLAWVADEADLTLDLTDTPTGEFNYIDDRSHSIAQALDVLNGYLLPRGYVTIRRDRFLAVLKTSNPVISTLIPAVPVSEIDEYGDNELIRVVVSVSGLDPTEVAGQVSGVLGPQGKAIPLNASESLILQGFGKTLRETVELLSGAIVPPADDTLTFRSFHLESIPAADAERQIQNLFGLSSNPYQTSMARRAAYEQQRYGSRDSKDNRERPQGPTPLVANLAMNMKVSALPQSNSLLVTATPAAIELIENILQTIDKRPSDDAPNQFSDNTPVLRVYRIENADEDDVAETLNAVIPGVVINEDGRHNAVHILATPTEHQEVENLIRVIEGGETGAGIEIIKLTRSDPYEMRDLLSSLFQNEDRDERPVIMPDLRSSSLVVRAAPAQMDEIKKTLAAYGETSAVSPTSNVTNRFRKLNLQSHDNAERIAKVVQELLRDDQNFMNPIRIVVPSEERTTEVPVDLEFRDRSRREIPRERTTSGERRSQEIQTLDPPQSEDNDFLTIHAHQEHLQLASYWEAKSSDSGATSRSSRSLRDEPRDTVPRVTIEVQDGDLLMYSNDGVALDQVEATIRELVRQMPSRTRWTVFYLKAASAEQTAQNLVDLLQSDQDPNTSIGVGIDETAYGIGAQSTRIIPDARTNALFMSGPESQVNRASQFIKILDTTDLPESLRDRIPRAIPVQYADVNLVADMVRELYKDFMEDPIDKLRDLKGNDRNRDNESALVSATASRTTGLQPPGIRLTLTVDEPANSILVSCNEQLFEQIRQLVLERDLAAKETQPTMRVIQLNEVGTVQVESMLGNLSPQISISSPARSSSRAGSRFSSSRTGDRSGSSRSNR